MIPTCSFCSILFLQTNRIYASGTITVPAQTRFCSAKSCFRKGSSLFVSDDFYIHMFFISQCCRFHNRTDCFGDTALLADYLAHVGRCNVKPGTGKWRRYPLLCQEVLFLNSCCFEDFAYYFSGLCTIVQPFLCQFFIYLELTGIFVRIIDSDFLDESSVSGRSGICHDNSVKRSLLLSHSS